MVKKVRLLDEEDTNVTEEATTTASTSSNLDTEKLMKFLEAIDWKLWEMLKLMRKQNEDESK